MKPQVTQSVYVMNFTILESHFQKVRSPSRFSNIKPFFITMTARPIANSETKEADFKIKGSADHCEIQVKYLDYKA